MNNNLNKKYGFSLAEALITLLIVCLITLASVPVLTKKHRRNLQSQSQSQSHGSYTCFIDSDGKYHYRQETNGVEETDVLQTNYCEFTPPADGRDFAITVVGAGGGGGDGENEWANYGGGSGGYNTTAVDLKKTDLVSVTIGRGGSSKRTFKDESGKTIINKATRGGNSQIIAHSAALSAIGGYGNSAGSFSSCFYENNDGCPGKPNGNNSRFDSLTCPSYSDVDPYKSMMPNNLQPRPGCGGFIYYFLSGLSGVAIKQLEGAGSDGFAAISSQNVHCGKGGGRGIVSMMSINKLSNKKIQLKIGKGGAGSLNKDTPAESGGFTKFGALVIADGGRSAEGGSGGRGADGIIFVKW